MVIDTYSNPHTRYLDLAYAQSLIAPFVAGLQPFSHYRAWSNPDLIHSYLDACPPGPAWVYAGPGSYGLRYAYPYLYMERRILPEGWIYSQWTNSDWISVYCCPCS
jgi:hypothetical protein